MDTLNNNLLNTNTTSGLNDEEVSLRQKQFGKNKFEDKKKKNPFLVYLSQFKDVLVIILLCATFFSFAMAIVQGVHAKWNWSTELIVSFVEPAIILFVLLTNSLIGAIQEIKSEKATDSLKKLNPLNAKVIRNGNLVTINSEELTIGDIVFLEAGDIVPADGTLISSTNLFVIESSLTGESVPVEKDFKFKANKNLPLAERKNELFSSTIVASGNATMIVTKIAKDTELGKIVNLVNEQKEKLTPLQIKITKLGKIFGFIGIGLFVISALMQIIFHAISKASFANTAFWSTVIINGISLAVAAIPEGLIAFTSIILAIGIQRMVKQKAIVKDLMTIETLGSCSIICSDKTGTLTQNKMTVVDFYAFNKSDTKAKLIEYATLCSDANLFYENGIKKETGDPTELAFLYALEEISEFKTKKELDAKYPRIIEFPFDSDRKLMTSINKINNKEIIIVKGAPDILLTKCSNLTKKEKELITLKNNEFSEKAYRVIAIASKENTEKDHTKLKVNDVENNLNFVGLIALIDPPRENSRQAILECKHAHIKTIMITGDNLVTAKAIAKDLGIFNEGDIALRGEDLDKLSDEELINNIEKYSVYARVKPEDKLRIVNAWQANNHVVAMTGDGVNDSPALKTADIGCAMGVVGTEASKEAADMILADDNFSTIVKAVNNGRSIYAKIKTVILNLLITSVAEIVLIFLGMFIFKFVFKNQIDAEIAKNPNFSFHILGATQLLWINLFTHGFPAIALGLQEPRENFMNQKPTPKNESIFAKGMGINALWKGILVGLISMVGYYLGAIYALNHAKSEHFVEYGSTIAFLVLGILATFNAINLMDKKLFILCNPIFYWKVYVSVLFSLGCLFIVSFIKNIAPAFKVTQDLTSTKELLIYSLCLPLIVIPIYATQKIINLIREKRAQK